MSSATPHPVDLVHLARYTGGDRNLNMEILRLFTGQAGEMVQQLKAVVESQDAKTWRYITHSLKGAARGVGAFALADVAAEAEPLDLIRDTGAALAAVHGLRIQTEAVQGFVEDYLAS